MLITSEVHWENFQLYDLRYSSNSLTAKESDQLLWHHFLRSRDDFCYHQAARNIELASSSSKMWKNLHYAFNCDVIVIHKQTAKSTKKRNKIIILPPPPLSMVLLYNKMLVTFKRMYQLSNQLSTVCCYPLPLVEKLVPQREKPWISDMGSFWPKFLGSRSCNTDNFYTSM